MSKEEEGKKKKEGSLTPFADQMVNAYTKLSEGKFSKEILEDILEGTRATLPKLTEIPRHSEVDLGAHWNTQVLLAAGGVVGVDATLVALSLATHDFIAPSLGDILDETFHVPPLSSMISMINDVVTLSYYTVDKPLSMRHLMSLNTPLIPEPYRLADASAKGILSGDDYFKAMAESGLSNFWATIYSKENEQFPNLETSLALLRRGNIDSTIFYNWLDRQSIKEVVADRLYNLKDVIPPLNDLIHMAVREAFGDHSAEVQLPELHTWASKMGLSEYLTEAYWYAHWDRIALAQCYDNLWRGNWNEEQFMALLRIKDIHPDDRQAILDVAYRPPSIRELGYGWDVNKYTREDMVRYRRMEGLSLEDAGKAADSLIDYRLEAEREALRREWMHLYAINRLSEDDFRANLESVFTMDSRTELWIERGKLEAQRKLKPDTDIEYRIVTSSEAKWMFVEGLKDEDWYRAKLLALDWEQERIDVAVERAIAEKAEVKEVIISVAELEKLYKSGQRNKEQLIIDLKFRNWRDEDVAIQLEVWNKEIAEAEDKAQEAAEKAAEIKPVIVSISTLESLYKKGKLTWEQIEGELTARNYTEEAKALLKTEWNTEIAEVEAKKQEAAEKAVEVLPRELTISYIESLYKAKLRNVNWAGTALSSLKYTDENINDILQMWNNELAETEAKAQEKLRTEALPRELSRTDIVHEFDIGSRDFDGMVKGFIELNYSEAAAYSIAVWEQFNIIFSDLRALYSKGWIDAEGLLKEVIDLKIPEERAKELVMTVVKFDQPERLEDERTLTKAEIVKGVKNEIITVNDGVALLMDIGYEEWEAYYILAIEKVVAVGDPEGYWDMKKVTEAYKKATGKKSKKVPDDLLIWEQRVKQLQEEVNKMKAEKIDEVKLSEKIILLNEAEANYRRMMQEWERSES